MLRIDGQDPAQADAALAKAKSNRGAPTLIVGKTTIAYGSPHKAGSHQAHGEPLGPEEVAATKKALGFPPDQSFYVPEEVRALCQGRVAELKREDAGWVMQVKVPCDQLN